MNDLETRVGYVALSVLRDQVKQYILAHTENNKYVGEVLMLDKYVELTRSLEGK